MRTQLSQFCEEFEQVIRPLLRPLNRSTESLTAASPKIPGKEVLAEMKDLGHQLEMLADKVAEQQAYVLIFGPLKSGKSTLMNGLSAAYVSEVTSLPAYPCMVYVSHADKQQYTLRRYDGNSAVYSDAAPMRELVEKAHTELAERVRAREDLGESFDPATDFQQAIRRIDVKIPARNLARSGAVLVDTPGLYSRMKFGYDRMTREFRNAAACAIFVVKSDNLFLEQVFAEFTDLLELFSRIFLVVNLDTSKRDLGPDGKLVPSLESANPQKIIEAFETLVMSAPLKSALDEGRLKIYPVDLLQSASQRLQRKDGDEDVEQSTEESAPGVANFDTFHDDLTDYLNSTDYLISFLGDSLRRASTLLSETSELCRHDSIEKLSASVEELEAHKTAADGRKQAAERLVKVDWRASFAELKQKIASALADPARQLTEDTAVKLHEAVARWFKSDASFQSLNQDQLVPILEGFQQSLADLLRSELDDRVAVGKAGLRPNKEAATDMQTAMVDLGEPGRVALEEIDIARALDSVEWPLHLDDLPLRKTFMDKILLRSSQSIQKRVIGTPERPNLRIPIAMKTTRLGDPGKAAIRKTLDRALAKYAAEAIERVREQVLGDYSSVALDLLQITFKQKCSDYSAEAGHLQRELKERRRVLNHLGNLTVDLSEARESIDGLTERYGRTDPDLLIQPMPAGDKPLPVPAPDDFGKDPLPAEGMGEEVPAKEVGTDDLDLPEETV